MFAAVVGDERQRFGGAEPEPRVVGWFAPGLPGSARVSAEEWEAPGLGGGEAERLGFRELTGVGEKGEAVSEETPQLHLAQPEGLEWAVAGVGKGWAALLMRARERPREHRVQGLEVRRLWVPQRHWGHLPPGKGLR